MAQKLYTEEQVNKLRRALKDIAQWDEYLEDIWEDAGNRATDALKSFKNVIPIELPSDEEIEEKTAVEWLVSKTELNYYSDNDTLLAIAKAKQMEKEQHGDTWDAAIKAYEDRGNLVWRSICDFDDYYNETYGNNTNK